MTTQDDTTNDRVPLVVSLMETVFHGFMASNGLTAEETADELYIGFMSVVTSQEGMDTTKLRDKDLVIAMTAFEADIKKLFSDYRRARQTPAP